MVGEWLLVSLSSSLLSSAYESAWFSAKMSVSVALLVEGEADLYEQCYQPSGPVQ
jgi:hypothetical protein